MSIGATNGYWLGGTKDEGGWTGANASSLSDFEGRPTLENGEPGLCQMMSLKDGILLPDDTDCEAIEAVKV